MIFLYNKNIPALPEVPTTFKTAYSQIPAGRVDIEVRQKYLFELKITPFAQKDELQLRRYVRAYQSQGRVITGAAVITFTNTVNFYPIDISSDMQ